MKKILKVFLSMLLCFGMVFSSTTISTNAATLTTQTQANVDKVISYASQLRKANTAGKTSGKFTWDTESKGYSWAYFNGLMLDAFNMVGSSEDLAFTDAFYNANIGSTGNIVNFTTSTAASTGALDSVEPIRAVFDVLKTSSNAAKYKKGIQTIYTMVENQISYSNCGGNLCHKQDSTTTVASGCSSYPIYLDGLYMAEPFLMECANAIDEGILTLTSTSNTTVTSSSIYSAVYTRMVWIYNNMYNSSTHLYNHAYSPSSGKTNGVAWSRSIGWYVMALVDIIDMMPEGTYKTNLEAELPRIFDGLLEYQDSSTGMWYNLPNYTTNLSKNQLETSGTAMFAYGMIKAYQNGYVTDSKYYDAGIKAFNGIVNNKMTGSAGNYSVTGTYLKSGVGTTASYYTQYSYTTNEAKGVGALIMCAALLQNGGTCDHVYGDYVANGNVHEKTCTLCGDVVSEAHTAGTAVKENEVAATCTTKGSYNLVTYCTVCGAKMSSTTVSVDKLSHTAVTDPAVAATCTTTGLTAGSHCSVCNTVITAQSTVAALGHNYKSTVTKEATCEEDGVMTYTCTRCNDSYTEVIPATDHTVVTDAAVEATCTTTGLTAGTHCSDCGKVIVAQEVVPAIGHTAVTDKAVAATCTTTGLTEGSHCSVCGEVIVAQEKTPMIAHTVVTDAAVEATCTTTGLTEGSHCAVCGKVITAQEVVPAKGHTAVIDEAVEATCTETGLTEGSHCSVCNAVITAQEEIPALGHNYKSEVTQEATETTDGLMTYTCTRCGDSYTEVILALGHTEVIDAAVPATCTTSGLTEGSHCSVCGTVIKAQEEIPALGHTIVTDAAVEATCTEAGLTEGSHCSTCGEVIVAQEVVPAKGHTVVTDAAVEATCTKAGLTEGSHCSVCGEVIVAQEEIPALSHTVVIDATVEATCTTSGLTEGSHCSVCNTVIKAQEEIQALSHDYESEVTKEATCTEEGMKTYTCTRCGDSYTKAINALGHTFVTDAGKAATCTEDGLTTGSHCSVCNEVISAQEVIPAAGHTVVTDAGKAATCTAAGLTEGSHCSVCGTVITAQGTIPATGHTVVTDAAVEATGTTTGLTEGSHCSVCGTVIVAQEVIPATGHEETITTTETVYQLATSITAGKQYVIASGKSGTVTIIANKNGTATKVYGTVSNGVLTFNVASNASKSLWTFASSKSGKIYNNGLYIKLSSSKQFSTSGETLTISNLGSGAYRIYKRTSSGYVYYLNPNYLTSKNSRAATVYLYEVKTITTTQTVMVYD